MKFQKVIDKRTGLEYDWKLVFETEEEIIEFHKKTDPSKIRDAWDNIVDTINGKSHIHTTYARFIWYHLQTEAYFKKTSILETTIDCLDRVINNKIECVKNHGKIYQNKFGGYFPHSENIEVLKEFIIDQDKLIFPSYTEKDIKVQQWEDGKHWYAYVGDIWVEDYSGKKKFDTHKRAMEVAKSFLHKINNQMYEFKS